MRTDSVKKYVIPNIPYLFILWACLKLGTAYRLAPGADFAHKLMGLGQSIGPAFADFAPGLAPFDWLIGIVGAVGFRLLIYFKSKNAKKFRRDEEYGSARWGTEKDIKPFVDPKFENNVILTKTEFLTMNTRPKNPANARNLNACIIGSSGSGKTRFWLTPQLLQAHSSYVCVDPKGGVLSQVGAFLQRRGYQVKVFNSIDFSKSMHYNPLSYIHNEADILKFVDTLIANTKGEGKEGDPFWTKAETLLYCALIAYIIFEAPAEDRNINTLVDMISGMDVKEDDESYMNAVDYMFKGLEKRKPDCCVLAWMIPMSLGGQANVIPNFGWWCLCGVLWGLGIIVPGMSPSNIFFFLGLATPMYASIGALDLGVILPMGVCLLLTVVLLSRGVGYCLKRWYSLFMHAVVGVVLASTVVILPPVKLLISPGYTFAMGLGDWLIYAGCFAAGAVLAWALGKVQGKE